MRCCCVDNVTINRPHVGMDLKQPQETNSSEETDDGVSVYTSYCACLVRHQVSGNLYQEKKNPVSASFSFHIILLAVLGFM